MKDFWHVEFQMLPQKEDILKGRENKGVSTEHVTSCFEVAAKETGQLSTALSGKEARRDFRGF